MISVQQVTKRFQSATAVESISFEVTAGEIFAFLGPNGAGKTTTIRMLTTLLKPTSGSLSIDGLDVATDAKRVRGSIGIVFQDPSLDQELSALENLELHCALYRVPREVGLERGEKLLKAFDLWERKEEPVRNFSGGMKRRLEVVRGLLHRPKVLFLDEPTIGLDVQSRIQLWRQVKQLNTEERVTVFFTTHYLEEADRVASRVALIDHGKIVALGSPQELKQKHGKQSLEEVFLALTGSSIRNESGGTVDRMRQIARALGRAS